MKKSYSALLMAMLVAAPAISVSAREDMTWDKTWNKSTHQLTAATTDKAKDWQADLPDNLFLAHVSIPGTHDSATGHPWDSALGATFSTTQEAEIGEMMDRGIRAWDFRPGWNNNKLVCSHGTTHLKITMDEAFKLMTDFLTAHPGEFFVVHLFKGNIGNDGSESEKNNMNNAMGALFNEGGKYASFVEPFRPDLKVGDVRGKIVFLQRDAMNYVNMPGAGYLTSWSMTFNQEGSPLYQRGNASESTRIVTQDQSGSNDGTIDTKKENATNLINYYTTQATPNDGFKANGSYLPKFAMNFLSRGNSTSAYRSNAVTMTAFMLDYLNGAGNLGRGPLGITMCDWVLRQSVSGSTINSDELVYRIIENNFTGGNNAPVVRYAIDETLDWDSPTVYLRNVATGKYLASGLWWGTHAAADDCGLQLKLVDVDGGTKIVTTLGGNVGIGADVYADNGNPVSFVKAQVPGTNYYTFTTDGKQMIDAGDCSGWTGGAYDHTIEYAVDYDDPKKAQWEILTLEDILQEAAAGAETGKVFPLSMTMPESQVYGNDTNAALWANNFVSAKSYTQSWRCGGDYPRFVMRFAHENKQSNDSFVYDRTINGLPDGNYRVDMMIASKMYDAANLDGFSFKINNGEELKSKIHTIPSDFDNNGYGCEAGGLYFNQNIDAVKLSYSFKVENGSINFHIEKPHLGTAGALYLDNINIYYLGKDKTNIELDFPMHYNTMVLPFDVEEMPGSLKAYSITGHEDKVKDGIDYHVLSLAEVASPKANVPYIVVNEDVAELDGTIAAEQVAVRRANGVETQSTAYTFSGYPHEAPECTDANGYLTGVHNEATVEAGHYVLCEYNNVQHFTKAQEAQTIEAHRAYVNGNAGSNVEHQVLLFKDGEYVLTGIEDIVNDADAAVEYFNMQGIRVANPVKGVYIRRQGSKTVKVVVD